MRFLSADGHVALRYGGLKAWDATQRELPAHLEVQGRELALVVNDQNATYPVTIDPLISSQEAKLTANDGAAGDLFGLYVSVSEDGNTALVAAVGDDTSAGAYSGSAYVFVRNGGSWSQQAKLVAADGAPNATFGQGLSLSGDGNTALIGAAYADTPAGFHVGSAYVFVRNGTSWSQQVKLTAVDGLEEDAFGYSVSLSRDGNRALMGAGWSAAGMGPGRAYVFARSGSVWSQEAELFPTGGAPDDYFGYSVSLSSEGDTALVGAPFDPVAAGELAGGAYVFVRTGSTWSQQAKLTAADRAAGDLFGIAVSLSTNGNTALLGAGGDDASAGSAYVFMRHDSTWSQQARLMAANRAADDRFGLYASLSGDGHTALIGADHSDTDAGVDAGSAYLFASADGVWSQQAQLTAGDGAARDRFGASVSLSGDASTAVVGAFQNDTAAGVDAGSAYVFRLVTPAPAMRVQQPAGTELLAGRSTVDFGTVDLGNHAARAFLITNSGTADLMGLQLTLDGANASAFMITTNPVAPVAPGGTTTFTVTFNPTNTAAQSAALHIPSNDPLANPFDIALTGTGDRFPVAGPDSAGTTLNRPQHMDAAKLLRNDSDPDGDPLTLSAVSVDSAQGGLVSLAGDIVTYTPPTNYLGMDSFTYTVSDGRGGTATGTVTMQVSGGTGASLNIVTAPHKTNGVFHVRFAGVPAYVYTIQSAPEANGPWTTLTTLPAGTNGLFDLFDATEAAQRFYRTVP